MAPIKNNIPIVNAVITLESRKNSRFFGTLIFSESCSLLPNNLPAHDDRRTAAADRSEEHTSELQSRFDLVCRLLLEKKKVSLWNDAGDVVMCNVLTQV